MTTTEFLDYLARYDTTRELGQTLKVIVDQRRDTALLARGAAISSAHTSHAA